MVRTWNTGIPTRSIIRRTKSPERMRAAPIVLGILLMLPSAAAIALAPLPPDPIAQQARLMETKTLPVSNSPNAALADVAQALTTKSASAHSTALDEGTTLNAMAIDRNGGDLTLSDIASTNVSRSRSSAYAQGVVIDPRVVLAALALGVGSSTGPLELILTATRAFSTSDTLTRERSLSDENTLSQIALGDNGIAIDPHRLIDEQDVARGGSVTAQLAADPVDPKGSQTVSLSRETAGIASVAFHAEGAVSPLALENLSLSNSDHGSEGRTVSVPTDLAFHAIALHNNGVPVAGDDLLSLDESESLGRVDDTTRTFSRETVLNALILGAHA